MSVDAADAWEGVGARSEGWSAVAGTRALLARLADQTICLVGVYAAVFAFCTWMMYEQVADYAFVLICFDYVHACDEATSAKALVALFGVSGVVGLGFTLSRHDSCACNAAAAAIAAAGLYLLPYLFLSDLPVEWALLAVVVIVAGGAAFRRMARGETVESVLADAPSKLLDAVVLAGFASIACFYLVLALNIPYARAQVEAVSQEDRYLAANIDDAAFMVSDNWDQAPLKQRLACLQSIARVEANYLNVSEPIVEIALLPGETKACYGEGTILVNVTHLCEAGSGLDSIESIAHEMAHCFQQTVIEDPSIAAESGYGEVDGETLERWRAEFSQYCSSGAEYYTQDVEASARAYAASSVQDILDRVVTYLLTGDAEA